MTDERVVSDIIILSENEKGAILELHRRIPEFDKLFKRAETMEGSLATLAMYGQHLTKLDTIATAITEMKTGLIGPATGIDRVPVATLDAVVKIFAWVIVGLVGILSLVITGKAFGYLPF